MNTRVVWNPCEFFCASWVAVIIKKSVVLTNKMFSQTEHLLEDRWNSFRMLHMSMATMFQIKKTQFSLQKTYLLAAMFSVMYA